MPRMSLSRRTGLTGCPQLVIGVRADGLEHGEPRLSVGSLDGGDQTHVDEVGDDLECLVTRGGADVRGSDGRNGVQVGAARENTQPTEYRLLERCQELIGP